MQYSDQLLHIYELCGQNLPVEAFAQRVNLKAIGLSSPAELYKPVAFTVQITERNIGSVRVEVPVAANKQWYSDLQKRLAGTIGTKSVLDLRTVTGTPLASVPVRSLASVGTLYAYTPDGTRFVTSALPTVVPVEFSVNKRAHIDQWHKKALVDTLPSVVAAELVKHGDAPSVDMALEPGGSVHKLIQEHVRASVPNWAEHVRVHHTCASSADSTAVLKCISNNAMERVRTYLQAGSAQIHQYLADKRGIKSSVLGTKTSGKAVNGPELYKRLVEDAMSCPTIQQQVSIALHTATNFEGSRAREKTISTIKPTDHHPWFAHMHHTLLPMRGTYPSDYMVRHAHQDMSAKAPFYGNVQAAYDAYHLISGLHSIPPGLVLKNGVPVTISCPSHEDEDEKAMEAGLVPMFIDIKERMRNRLVPIQSAFPDAPGLVSSRAPPVRPIDSGLVHIECGDPEDEEGYPDIESNMGNQQQERDEDEYAHLPTADDIWA